MNLVGRQYSLFDVGTPEEKIELGLCPHSRCLEKANEGFGIAETGVTCCCKHCWFKEIRDDSYNGYCNDCPIKPVPSIDDDEHPDE